eukprot:74627-Chlamydomonas_euryale.AAC.5
MACQDSSCRKGYNFVATDNRFCPLSRGPTLLDIGNGVGHGADNTVIMYLPVPCYSHGQFYVAMSRVGSGGGNSHPHHPRTAKEGRAR